MNVCLLTDSYKFSHWRQYPPRTQHVYSYLESRGGRYPDVTFFGLQYLLQQYLEGAVVTQDRIEEADQVVTAHIGPGVFNREGWEYILNHHAGRLPVRIKAVPEGMTVPVSNVLMTIENTDPAVPWLTNYLETLLVQVWYPTTVATQSRHIKQCITRFAELTGDPSLVGFKLHDFGFRGVSSVESAALGGAAHLVNFQGTDTVAALILLRDIYGTAMAGFSIPAAEHSTITAWGREAEVEAYRNMLTQYPTGLVACVSDSYDIFHACKKLWGSELKAEVLARDGVLVVRPDSGDPATVVVAVLDILGDAFGYDINDKQYRVLNPKVRVIQGDGVDAEAIEAVLENMRVNGWSTDNIAFGMGGALLQKLNRDTQSFAMKCSNVVVDGVERPVCKQPTTDGGKGSKAGRLKLVRGVAGNLLTMPDHLAHTNDDLLQPVFENGQCLRDWTFEEVRANAAL